MSKKIIISGLIFVATWILASQALASEESTPNKSIQVEDEFGSDQIASKTYVSAGTIDRSPRKNAWDGAGGTACCNCGIKHYGKLPDDFPAGPVGAVTFYLRGSRKDSYYTRVKGGPTKLKLRLQDKSDNSFKETVATSTPITSETILPEGLEKVHWIITFKFDPPVMVGPGSAWQLLDGDNNKYSAVILHMSNAVSDFNSTNALPGTSDQNGCQYTFKEKAWYSARFDFGVPKPGLKTITAGSASFNYDEDEIKKYIYPTENNKNEEKFKVGFYEYPHDWSNAYRFHDSLGAVDPARPSFDYREFNANRNNIATESIATASSSAKGRRFSFKINTKYLSGPRVKSQLRRRFKSNKIELSPDARIYKRENYREIIDGAKIYRIEPGHTVYLMHEPSQAIDGNDQVGDWVSIGEPSHFQLDLGEERLIRSIVLKRQKDSRMRIPENFDVLISNSGEFKGEEVLVEKVTGNQQEERWIEFEKPISTRFVRLKIYTSWGSNHIKKCKEKEKVYCSAAIDELEIYEATPYWMRYEGVDYLPISISNSEGKVGNLLIDSEGDIVDDYDTLWAVFNMIHVLRSPPYMLPTSPTNYMEIYDSVSQKLFADSDDASDYIEKWGITERVARDLTSVILNVQAGNLWGGVGIVLSAMNTYMLLQQLWDMSEHGDNPEVPEWKVQPKDLVDAGITIKGQADVVMIVQKIKSLNKDIVNLWDDAIKQTRQALSLDDYWRVSSQHSDLSKKVTKLEEQGDLAIYSALLAIEDVYSRDTALDAMAISTQFAQAAIAYRKVREVLESVIDGVDNVEELRDLAKLKIMAAYGTMKEKHVLNLMVDSYDQFTDKDWRAKVIYGLHPIFEFIFGDIPTKDQIHEKAQEASRIFDDRIDKLAIGFMFDYLAATADAKWAMERIEEMTKQ